MKITFLCAEVNQGGGSRVTSIYAKKLLDMGHDVTVVSRQPRPVSRKRQLVDRLRGRAHKSDPKRRTVHFDPLGERHHWLPWKWPVAPEDLPDADILVATFWRTAFEVTMMPPEKGKKAYFVQHHEVHQEQPRDLAAGSYRLPLKKITIADWLVEAMARDYGDTDVVKVENAVDTNLFQTPPRAKNTTPRVGFMYAKVNFKGLDVALKAIEIARKSVPNLEVLAFGRHGIDPKMPLPQGAVFHPDPEQSNLKNLYASCDAWLFSSRSEGFGLPLLESMACRTPVMATRAGAAPDLIEDGINGRLVNIDDAEALAAALVETISLSPDAWRAMSDAAHTRAHSYTWDDAAKAFEAALMRIADTP